MDITKDVKRIFCANLMSQYPWDWDIDSFFPNHLSREDRIITLEKVLSETLEGEIQSDNNTAKSILREIWESPSHFSPRAVLYYPPQTIKCYNKITGNTKHSLPIREAFIVVDMGLMESDPKCRKFLFAFDGEMHKLNRHEDSGIIVENLNCHKHDFWTHSPSYS